VGWQITINARIGFKLHFTAMPGFHSLCDWCFQMMWLFSDAPEDPEDDTVMENHGTKALYSAVQGWMHAIRTEDQNAQLDATHWMIHIAKPWKISRGSESQLGNRKPPVLVPIRNPHSVDFEWPEEEEAKRPTLLER
jgi:hypothetical protein